MFTENKITEFKQAIRKLADRPQMSAQALKEYFDGSAEELRVALNALIDALSGFAAHTISDVQYTAADGKLTFITASGEEVCIDLPLELLVESGHYDAAKQNIVLVLANGDELNIPVGDLVGAAIDTYHADGQTLVCKDNTFSVKDGVFATAKQTAEDIASAKNTVLAESKAYTDALKEKTKADIASTEIECKEYAAVRIIELRKQTAENINSSENYMIGVIGDHSSFLRNETTAKIAEAKTSTLSDAKAYTDEMLADVKTNGFELIASGKITEEVNSILITKDNDGNPFELCDMINIYTYSPQHNADSYLAYDFNGDFVHRTHGNVVNSGARIRQNFHAVYTGKFWDCCSAVGNARTATVYTNLAYDGYGSILRHDAIINKITIRTADIYSSITLPIGFTYEIYGRRVKK